MTASKTVKLANGIIIIAISWLH